MIDYVVIGAGMAGELLKAQDTITTKWVDVLMPSRSIGASTAYHLIRPGVADGETVIVLEVKDVASGPSQIMLFIKEYLLTDRGCD